MEHVNRYTRAPREGRIIICPWCDWSSRVYHFSWYAIRCQRCESDVKKYDWLVR